MNELLWGLILFSFVSSITPGPNNIMLLASGSNFGVRRTIPHMLGIGIGFTLMIILVGLVLFEFFERFAWLDVTLTVISLIYLVWLAWKIATAKPTRFEKAEATLDGNNKPFTFLQAALFQWVNPKAWIMALSALSVYAPNNAISAVLLVAVIFGAINIPCVSVWAALGEQAQRILTNPTRQRVFNITMAALLIASMLPILF